MWKCFITMSILIFISYVLLIDKLCSPSPYQRNTDLNVLTENFFENLRADPKLLSDADFSERSKIFIDRQIETFKGLLVRTKEDTLKRSKRSLNEDQVRSSKSLIDATPYLTIPTKSPRDIVIFHQNSNYYALTLEALDETPEIQELAVFKYENKLFKKIGTKPVLNGVKIAAFPLEDFTVIIVAENRTETKDLEENTAIYKFTFQEQIERVQTINSTYSNDVAIWKNDQHIFMSLSHYKKNNFRKIDYEVDVPIYKWYGRHFDIIQHKKTSGLTKITPFSIGDEHFLALANSKSRKGNFKTYSEILLYNLETEKYEPYQSLLTRACSDIKHFKISEENHFLIVANSHEKGTNTNSNQAKSIIYKYVDKYFMPFQSIGIEGATSWEPIMDDTGDILLLAITKNGITPFQYDGWQFTEAAFKNPSEIFGKGIKSLRAYSFEGKSVIVIANENDDGNKPNVFQVNFTSFNELKRKHKELTQWCFNNIKRIDAMDVEEHQLLAQSLRGDINVNISKDDDDTQQINQALENYDIILNNIETQAQKSVQSDNKHTFYPDLKAKQIILENSAILNSIHTNKLNGINIDDLLNNTLNINHGFQLTSAEFDLIFLEEPVTPKRVNDISSSHLLRTTHDLTSKKVTINGDVTFNNGVTVTAAVNNIQLDKEKILLIEADQNLTILNADSVTVNKLTAKYLNNVKVTSDQGSSSKRTVNKLDSLKSKNIVIGGLINKVSIPILDRYALKKHGDQDMFTTCYFDNLEADDLEVQGLLSGHSLDEFISIKNGSFRVDKDIMFTEDLDVHSLTARMFLNSIPVKNGQLEILLKDSSLPQYISRKTFEYLELLNPINLRGKIRSEHLDTFDPMVTVAEDIVVEGDVEISGDLMVEELIRASNVKTTDGENSLKRVMEKGLKLAESEVPVRLDFAQHMVVDEIFADKINDIDPHTWVVNGAKHPQTILGWKKFEKDLKITGSTDVFKINNIIMSELESNTLRTDGDQIISGKHYFQNIRVNKIKTNHTMFGQNPWSTVMTKNEDQTIKGSTIFEHFKSNMTTVKEIKIKGLINDINFDEMVIDTAMKGTEFKIFGHKNFDNLAVDTLTVQNNPEITNQMKAVDRNEIILRKNVDFSGVTQVDHIFFTEHCNDIGKEYFGRGLTKNETLVIAEDQEFKQITVFGNVLVSSNIINNVNLTRMEQDTVKVDEAHAFEFVKFNDALIIDDILGLEGNIENLDIDNIFESGAKDQILSDEKTFKEDVIIEGQMVINGLLNDFNVSKLCEFSSANENSSKVVTISGNALFVKGPNVTNINGANVQNLTDTAWFEDTPASINGYIQFDKVIFENNVTVQGYFDDVNLQLLSQNYFSKSKDQNVSSHLVFDGGVVFERNVSTPALVLEGSVNGVKLNEFIQTALLDDYEQIFENTVFLEQCTVKDLKREGEFSVNALNLQTDVMRYDKRNQVTGAIKIKNLDIDRFITDHEVLVQRVNVVNWLQNSVLRNGTFGISGQKSIRSGNFKQGISLEGTLNSQIWDEETVMLKNLPQSITGKKTFLRNNFDEIQFKSMKVKGLVNDMELTEFIHNQAYKNTDNIIKSQMLFENNLTVQNVEFENLYRNVNVTQLISNVSVLSALDNFVDNYNGLLNMSLEIENSIKEQAYFLKYYKEYLVFQDSYGIFGLICADGTSRLINFVYGNGTSMVYAFEWNELQHDFNIHSGNAIDLGLYAYPPNYITQVTVGNKHCIYIEYVVDPSTNRGSTHFGKLISFINSTNFDQLATFQTNGTQFMKSFKLQILNNNCLLFITFRNEISVICDEDGTHTNYYELQTISCEGQLHNLATVENIGDSTYLITAEKASENLEAHLKIWKFDVETSRFMLDQSIYEGDQRSWTTVSFNNINYLAVAYGHVENTMHFGRISIRRFNKYTNQFEPWQTVSIDSPIHAEFAILPSKELILYVLTESTTEPFIVHTFEGISGFKKRFTGSTLQRISYMNWFSINNQHFVAAKHYDNAISIIEAVFKGRKWQ